MTILARTLAAGAVLVALGAPHLAVPTRAHADLCTACAGWDDPEVITAGVGLRPLWVPPVWRTARLRR